MVLSSANAKAPTRVSKRSDSSKTSTRGSRQRVGRSSSGGTVGRRRPNPNAASGSIAQRKAGGGAGPDGQTATPPSTAGAPLPAGVQTKMDAAFDFDFSNVRVHEGGAASEIGALAYTQGSDVHFGPGQYQPHSQSGQELLGHELAHVVQQAEGRVQATTQAKGVDINADEALEREADEMGAAAARGELVQRSGSVADMASSRPAAAQRKSGGVVQRASIDPNAYFGGARADNNVDSDINADELAGFGTKVKNADWHTKLTFDPLVQPGGVDGAGMHPEGSGVTGVIGPDHAYGSQPGSATAAQNNHTAAALRNGTPHVAAHIINDQLGGPGVSQNLFALPGVANTLMETQVESAMKAAVEAGSYIYYRGQVNHPANGPATSITMSWNKLDEDGNDIGGGQTNVTIDAAPLAQNAPLPGGVLDAQQPGAVAQNVNLTHPSNPTVVKARPWGPFQMPDPKQIIAVGAFLDHTEFPAVGNKAAFEAYLTAHKGNQLGLQMMFLSLNDTAMFTNIGRWIKHVSKIPIKRNRGVTDQLVKDLISGTSQKKQSAFIDLMATGDAGRIIPMAAGEFAKVARTSARSRV